MSTNDRAARARRAGQPAPGTTRRTWLPIVAVLAVVLVALGVALLAGGDEESGDDSTLATAPIAVGGDPLPPLPDSGEDPAVGTAAPTLEGVAPDGTDTVVEGSGEPTLLAFLAHWCPHCQAELPRLVDLGEEGALDGMRPVVVLTGTDERADNYPPAPWLEREGWDGEVVLDDEDGSAAAAFGLTSYPYLVLVDSEGEVIARSAGELGEAGLRDFIARAG